jgi:hypothetical protein
VRRAAISKSRLRYGSDEVRQDEPNVFLCVSSFNSGAQEFYERHNYECVGELRDFIIPGASEIVLRKTMAPKTVFATGPQKST